MRRKLLLGFVVGVFILVSAGWNIIFCQQREVMTENFDRNELIRFHVIANSDSPKDQAVKLQVRDAVISYLAPLFDDCKTTEDAKAVIISEKKNITLVANDILTQEGMKYKSDINIGTYDFPIKSYGNRVFPAGKYEAVRIMLGKAEGKNWWCVLFPPLCFIDAANATATSEKKDDLKLTSNNVEFKFKIIELWKGQ